MEPLYRDSVRQLLCDGSVVWHVFAGKLNIRYWTVTSHYALHWPTAGLFSFRKGNKLSFKTDTQRLLAKPDVILRRLNGTLPCLMTAKLPVKKMMMKSENLRTGKTQQNLTVSSYRRSTVSETGTGRLEDNDVPLCFGRKPLNKDQLFITLKPSAYKATILYTCVLSYCVCA